MVKKSENINLDVDNELLNQFRETGDLEILGTLYKNYIHLVYGVCLKYLNDREESKDAVNKIFEKLITEVNKFDIQNFKTWLYVLTKNYCLMHLRKEKAEKKRFEKYSEGFFMESTEVLHPIDEDRDENLENQLRICIDRLKAEQKECIQLFYYESKCYKEISKELEIDEKKVKSYIQNGKRNLKICIEQSIEKEHV